MLSSRQSVQYFGYYMLIVGLGFILIPNTILDIFGLERTFEPWIRTVGLFSAIVGGLYYQQMVKYNVKEFFWITVPGRILFSLGTASLVILGELGEAGYIFACFEFLCAILTWYLLSKEQRNSKS